MAKKRVRIKHEDRALIRMLRDRTGRGQSLLQISRTSRISKTRLLYLAKLAKVRYRGRPASLEQISVAVTAVLDEGATVRGAAKKAGISKTAAHRYVMKVRAKSTRVKGGIQFESNREFTPRKWRRQQYCPRHGLLSVWPCVACAALEYSREHNRARD